MADNVGAAARSRMMAAVRSKDTGPELALRRALHGIGLRYRLHRRDSPGTPDLSFVSAKVAVFVDGDFWHGRAWFRDGRAPESNRPYWTAKFEANRRRDRRVDAALRRMGWRPLRIWESDVRRDAAGCAAKAAGIVWSRSTSSPAAAG